MQDMYLIILYLLQVPGFKDWFNIKYLEDNAIYTYKLMDDLKEGTLKIVV